MLRGIWTWNVRTVGRSREAQTQAYMASTRSRFTGTVVIKHHVFFFRRYHLKTRRMGRINVAENFGCSRVAVSVIMCGRDRRKRTPDGLVAYDTARSTARRRLFNGSWRRVRRVVAGGASTLAGAHCQGCVERDGDEDSNWWITRVRSAEREYVLRDCLQDSATACWSLPGGCRWEGGRQRGN